LVHQIRLSGKFGDVIIVFFSESRRSGISREKADSSSDNKSTEDTGNGAFGVGRDRFVYTNSRDTITGFGGVTKIAFNNKLNRARKLTRRSSFREFLNGDLLVIHIGGETELGSKQVVLFVTGGVNSGSRETTVGSYIAILTGTGCASSRAVVHRADKLGAYQGAAGNDAADLNQLTQ
jgi:hypothetical protein